VYLGIYNDNILECNYIIGEKKEIFMSFIDEQMVNSRQNIFVFLSLGFFLQQCINFVYYRNKKQAEAEQAWHLFITNLLINIKSIFKSMNKFLFGKNTICIGDKFEHFFYILLLSHIVRVMNEFRKFFHGPMFLVLSIFQVFIKNIPMVDLIFFESLV